MGLCRSCKLMEVVGFGKLGRGLYLIERGRMKPMCLGGFGRYVDRRWVVEIRFESREEAGWVGVLWVIYSYIGILVTATPNDTIFFFVTAAVLMVNRPSDLLLRLFAKNRKPLICFLLYRFIVISLDGKTDLQLALVDVLPISSQKSFSLRLLYYVRRDQERDELFVMMKLHLALRLTTAVVLLIQNQLQLTFLEKNPKSRSIYQLYPRWPLRQMNEEILMNPFVFE